MRKRITYFKENDDFYFTEWICSQLRSQVLISDMAVYKEAEEIQAIYFLESGKAAYVLPRFLNRAFVIIEASETFGTVDIAFSQLELEE